MIKVLDCSLRDGGYYTDWDFDSSLIDTYFASMSKLPVDIVELGYRSCNSNTYYGEYFYTPSSCIIKARHVLPNKKLSVMVNTKEWVDKTSDFRTNLKSIVGLVDIVRFAVNPLNLRLAIPVISSIKDLGFELHVNFMQSHIFLTDLDLIRDCAFNLDFVTCFSIVDSYGSLFPQDITKLVAHFKTYSAGKLIGFHAHNNLELAFANCLEALTCGISIVDSTIMGIGRGAGNLRTELLLTHLNHSQKCDLNLSSLSTVVESFSMLQHAYGWGANLTYMVSGINRLPQANVMSLLSKRRYTYNSIVNSLTTSHSSDIPSNDLRSTSLEDINLSDTCLFVGGGESVENNIHYIKQWLLVNPNTSIIHSSLRHVHLFSDHSLSQSVILAGDEFSKYSDDYNEYIDRFFISDDPVIPICMPDKSLPVSPVTPISNTL